MNQVCKSDSVDLSCYSNRQDCTPSHRYKRQCRLHQFLFEECSEGKELCESLDSTMPLVMLIVIQGVAPENIHTPSTEGIGNS